MKLFGNFLIILFFCITEIMAVEYHVAKNGNDSNNGTKNSPFLTVQKAADIVKAGDIVIIHAGTYEEDVKPANSGTSVAPITFKAANGEKVIISEMQELNGWTLDKGSIYKTTVGWSLGQENFIVHNKTALDLARWPNNVDGDVYTMNSLRNDSGSTSDVINNAYIVYNAGFPNIDWSKGGSVSFYGDKPGSGWTTWRAFIKSSTANKITFDLDKNPEWIRTYHAPADKGDFFLQGAKGALDYKNEWYFDEDTKTLYVQLPNGVKPADGAIKMRKRTQAFNLTSRNYIHLEGFAVLGGSIDINGNGNKLYKISSFYGNYTLGVVTGFATGKQSVKISGNDNVIEQCEIAFGSGTGVYDSGKNTKILNSYIHHFNTIGNYDAVINARGGSYSVYKNNILSHSGRDVIQAFNKHAEYAYNDISYSHLIADDCGLIYTVGGPSYSIIHHNWLHDAYSHGSKYKAAGIYLDNNSSSWDIHHNVVWNVAWTDLQINWSGKDLNIYNNTFVKGKATMGAWHKDGTAFDNVKLWNNITDKQGENAGGQESESTWDPQADLQNNLVSKESFLDYDNNDYRLKFGVEAIDYGKVIAGITDGYTGTNPDVGAYEFGASFWKPGITWDVTNGPTGNGKYNLPGEGYIPESGMYSAIPGQTIAINFLGKYDTLNVNSIIPTKVSYIANEKLDLYVILTDLKGNWLSFKKITVNAGNDTLNVDLNITDTLKAGKQYILKTNLRDVNGSWETIRIADIITTFIATNNTPSQEDSLSTLIRPYNQEKVLVYPNPINDKFTIILKTNSQKSLKEKILLVNQSGVVVSSLQRGVNKRANISKGIYYIVVSQKNKIQIIKPVYFQ